MMHAKKTLGQHFLTSSEICKEIVFASGIEKEDAVIEIGPGLGQLTTHILNTGAMLTAYDIDDRVEEPLKQKFHTEIQNKQFIFKHEDVSLLDTETISGPYKVIGNIPYYITGMILRQFLDASHMPSTITFLIQKEVAERICSEDGKESILSIAVKLRGTPSLLFEVPRTHFKPIPKVDSALIHIVTKPWVSDTPFSKVMEIVRIGFAHPRKKVFSNLKDIQTKNIESVKDICGDKRPEDLIPEDWIQIASLL